MADPAAAPLPVILRELAWTIHKRTPERAGVGPLPTIEVTLFKQIIDSPGSTVRELSEALGLHQPNTSAALRVLVGRGLVERRVGESDRRTAHIVPTEKGLREYDELAAAWSANVEDAIALLDPGERSALEEAAEAMLSVTRIMRAAGSSPAQRS